MALPLSGRGGRPLIAVPAAAGTAAACSTLAALGTAAAAAAAAARGAAGVAGRAAVAAAAATAFSTCRCLLTLFYHNGLGSVPPDVPAVAGKGGQRAESVKCNLDAAWAGPALNPPGCLASWLA